MTEWEFRDYLTIDPLSVRGSQHRKSGAWWFSVKLAVFGGHSLEFHYGRPE